MASSRSTPKPKTEDSSNPSGNTDNSGYGSGTYVTRLRETDAERKKREKEEAKRQKEEDKLKEKVKKAAEEKAKREAGKEELEQKALACEARGDRNDAEKARKKKRGKQSLS